MFGDALQHMLELCPIGAVLKERAPCVEKPVALPRALRSVQCVAGKVMSLVRNGLVDMNEVAVVRSPLASLQAVRDTIIYKGKVQTLLSDALLFEKSVSGDLIEHLESPFEAHPHLCNVLKVMRTPASDPWRTTLPNKVSQKDCCEKANETVMK